MRGLCVILAATLLAASAAAPAVASDDDWPELKANRLNDTPPDMAFAVYRAAAEAGSPIIGVSLYVAGPRRAPVRNARIVARRVDSEKGRIRIAWTDTTRCPALAAALEGLSALPSPRLVRPGLPNPRAAAPPSSGDDYLLWTSDARWSGRSDRTQLEIRASGRAPLQAWIDAAISRTARCWRPEPPAFP